HQEPRERRIAVGEVVDVGLARPRIRVARQAEGGEPRIAEVADFRRRNGINAEPEIAERATLETVRHLLAAAQYSRQIVAIARVLEQFALGVDRIARQRLALAAIERAQLRLARLRNRKCREEICEPACSVRLARRPLGHAARRFRHQYVAAKRFAREEQAARKSERGIKPALERGLKTRDL